MAHDVTVNAAWDAKAGVWTAVSDDVPGLCCEAETWDELAAVVADLTPELLRDNGAIPEGVSEIRIRIVAQQEKTAKLVA